MTSMSGLEGCCGASIIYDFHDIRPMRRSFPKGHLYIAILNHPQVETYEKDLLKRGFRLVSNTVRNSNTGNFLYLYVRDGKEPKVKQVKKRMFA